MNVLTTKISGREPWCLVIYHFTEIMPVKVEGSQQKKMSNKQLKIQEEPPP